MKQDFNSPPSPPAPARHDVEAFVAAAATSDTATLERYLATFSVRIIDQKDLSGVTALIWAASRDHHDVVALLLQRGAKIEEKDSEGRTALQWAEKNRHQAVADLIRTEAARRENLHSFPITRRFMNLMRRLRNNNL